MKQQAETLATAGVMRHTSIKLFLSTSNDDNHGTIADEQHSRQVQLAGILLHHASIP